MSTTTDPNDPRIRRGAPDEAAVPQNETYLVLSPEERARGFVRPLRLSYRHVGIRGPQHPTRELTREERERYGDVGYVVFEIYPPGNGSVTGRYWTQEQLDSVGNGCGTVTTMAQEIAETYARKPRFYDSTYCVACRMHRRVGEDGEFVWEGSGERVGS